MHPTPPHSILLNSTIHHTTPHHITSHHITSHHYTRNIGRSASHHYTPNIGRSASPGRSGSIGEIGESIGVLGELRLLRSELSEMRAFQEHMRQEFRDGLLAVDTRYYYSLLTHHWLTTDLPLTHYWLTTDLPLTYYWLTTDLPLTYYWLTTDSLLTNTRWIHRGLQGYLNFLPETKDLSFALYQDNATSQRLSSESRLISDIWIYSQWVPVWLCWPPCLWRYF